MVIPNGSLIFMQVLNYSQLAPWEVSWSIKEHFQCFYAWLSEPDNSVFYFDFHNEKINTSYLLSRIPWWHSDLYHEPAKARSKRQTGSIPGLARPLKEGMATQSSILTWRIPMDREAWWTIVHSIAKSQTRLSD